MQAHHLSFPEPLTLLNPKIDRAAKYLEQAALRYGHSILGLTDMHRILGRALQGLTMEEAITVLEIASQNALEKYQGDNPMHFFIDLALISIYRGPAVTFRQFKFRDYIKLQSWRWTEQLRGLRNFGPLTRELPYADAHNIYALFLQRLPWAHLNDYIRNRLVINEDPITGLHLRQLTPKAALLYGPFFFTLHQNVGQRVNWNGHENMLRLCQLEMFYLFPAQYLGYSYQLAEWLRFFQTQYRHIHDEFSEQQKHPYYRIYARGYLTLLLLAAGNMEIADTPLFPQADELAGLLECLLPEKQLLDWQDHRQIRTWLRPLLQKVQNMDNFFATLDPRKKRANALLLGFFAPDIKAFDNTELAMLFGALWKQSPRLFYFFIDDLLMNLYPEMRKHLWPALVSAFPKETLAYVCKFKPELTVHTSENFRGNMLASMLPGGPTAE